MKIKLSRNIFLCIFFFLLTFSGSYYCKEHGLDQNLEYVSYGLLMIALFLNYIKLDKKYRYKYINSISVIVLVCSVIGIFLNDLTLSRTMILFFTMFARWTCVFWGDNYINSFSILRAISYAILAGVMTSTFLAWITEHQLIYASEGILGFTIAFTGGIQFKNYFAADMLAVFIGLYFYRKYERRRPIDLFVIILSVILLLFSNSRGGYVLFVVFLVVANIDIIIKISKKQRKIFLCVTTILAILAFIYLYKNIALNSSTYMYRIRGLLNYLKYYNNDLFHMLLGNTESFYDQELSYVFAIRKVVGWDGSLEFAWLDVIVKSGCIGVLGFFLVFARFINTARKDETWDLGVVMASILATLLVSSLVEAYIETIHAVFGIYCYLVMAGTNGRINERIKT